MDENGEERQHEDKWDRLVGVVYFTITIRTVAQPPESKCLV